MLDQAFGQLFLNQWVVFAVLLILLVGFSELAWRIGLAGSRKKLEADKDSGTVRSAVLALLGLLLGFSFALAGTRHEARRELLVEEANSIITTARCAQLSPELHAANMAHLLRDYVPIRIEAHREAQLSDEFATTRKQSAELQDRMWAEAVAAAAERPSSITANFIASLNETIDLEAKRVADEVLGAAVSVLRGGVEVVDPRGEARRRPEAGAGRARRCRRQRCSLSHRRRPYRTESGPQRPHLRVLFGGRTAPLPAIRYPW